MPGVRPALITTFDINAKRMNITLLISFIFFSDLDDYSANVKAQARRVARSELLGAIRAIISGFNSFIM
jgi:hypothetical protein